MISRHLPTPCFSRPCAARLGRGVGGPSAAGGWVLLRASPHATRLVEGVALGRAPLLVLGELDDDALGLEKVLVHRAVLAAHPSRAELPPHRHRPLYVCGARRILRRQRGGSPFDAWQRGVQGAAGRPIALPTYLLRRLLRHCCCHLEGHPREREITSCQVCGAKAGERACWAFQACCSVCLACPCCGRSRGQTGAWRCQKAA